MYFPNILIPTFTIMVVENQFPFQEISQETIWFDSNAADKFVQVMDSGPASKDMDVFDALLPQVVDRDGDCLFISVLRAVLKATVQPKWLPPLLRSVCCAMAFTDPVVVSCVYRCNMEAMIAQRTLWQVFRFVGCFVSVLIIQCTNTCGSIHSRCSSQRMYLRARPDKKCIYSLIYTEQENGAGEVSVSGHYQHYGERILSALPSTLPAASLP